MDAASNNPSLAELIRIAVDRILMDVHTSMPGIIQEYDAATQSATVQPCLKRKYASETEARALPVLQNVPVSFPSFSGGWLKFPLKKGDRVLLIFAERSLDTWFERGGIVDPEIPEKFALSDAIAIVGLNDRNNALVPNGAASSVELSFGKAFIEITSDGKFKIKNDQAELLDVMSSILDHMIAFKSTNCVVGSPVTLFPDNLIQLNLDKVKLNMLKAS